DGKIVSLTVSAFNDTKGIGDAICDESFTSSFAGKGLADEVDICSGATYSSGSALAAARCALESAGN
ncbi:MAG: FMN-binding protein, partial [Solobacterium sp.]|nr:FMN-binding protein [Solobacterium sp.]